jgi:hypothetical protein
MMQVVIYVDWLDFDVYATVDFDFSGEDSEACVQLVGQSVHSSLGYGGLRLEILL